MKAGQPGRGFSPFMESGMVLLLTALFAVSSFGLVNMGADSYQRIVKGAENNFERRVPFSYLANKIRQHDYQGGIRIGQVDGLDGLVLLEEYDEVVYENWIYQYDGGLYELFIEQGMKFHPADGNKVMDIGPLLIQWKEPQVLMVSLVHQSGEQETLSISLRSARQEDQE